MPDPDAAGKPADPVFPLSPTSVFIIAGVAFGVGFMGRVVLVTRRQSKSMVKDMELASQSAQSYKARRALARTAHTQAQPDTDAQSPLQQRRQPDDTLVPRAHLVPTSSSGPTGSPAPTLPRPEHPPGSHLPPGSRLTQTVSHDERKTVAIVMPPTPASAVSTSVPRPRPASQSTDSLAPHVSKGPSPLPIAGDPSVLGDGSDGWRQLLSPFHHPTSPVAFAAKTLIYGSTFCVLLALGTVTAVKSYLEVDSLQEFAHVMRASLPSKVKGLGDFFRTAPTTPAPSPPARAPSDP